MKSYLLLQKYYIINFTNIKFSQFVEKNNKNIFFFSKCKCSIFYKKKNHANLEATHYLYLYLICKELPKLQKKQISSNKIVWNLTLQQKRKSSNLYLFLENHNIWKVLQILLQYIFSQQLVSERKVLQITKNEVQIFIENMPILSATTKLQSPNHYISEIPFCLSIYFKSSSLFKKLYFLKIFKFLKIPSYLEGLSVSKLL